MGGIKYPRAGGTTETVCADGRSGDGITRKRKERGSRGVVATVDRGRTDLRSAKSICCVL